MDSQPALSKVTASSSSPAPASAAGFEPTPVEAAMTAARGRIRAVQDAYEAERGRSRRRTSEPSGDDLAAQLRRRQDAAARSEPILCADGQYRRDPDLERSGDRGLPPGESPRRNTQRRPADRRSSFGADSVTRCAATLTAA